MCVQGIGTERRKRRGNYGQDVMNERTINKKEKKHSRAGQMAVFPST